MKPFRLLASGLLLFKRKILFSFFLLMPIGLCVWLVGFAYFSGGPSPECLFPSGGPVQPGITARKLVSGDRNRCYLFYIPPGYDQAQPLALVIALHGFASNGHGMRAMSAWEPIAEREKFLVVYPDGSSFPLRWNIGPIANIPDIDDVKFIRDIITDVSRMNASEELWKFFIHHPLE